MTDQPNRRRHPRHDVDDLAGRLKRRLEARVLDVSLGGVAIETDAPLPPNHSYALRLTRDGAPLDLTGQVRWSRLARSDQDATPVYRSGIQFDKALGPQAEELLPMLSEQTDDPTLRDRVFGRFAPAEGTRLTVGSEHPFQVRRLSLSGMLIESDLLPRINSRLQAQMPLNDHIETLRLDLRVVTTQPLTQPGVAWQVELGTEFMDLADEARDALAEYLEDIAG